MPKFLRNCIKLIWAFKQNRWFNFAEIRVFLLIAIEHESDQLRDIIFEYENKPEGSSEINKNAVLTVENSNVEIVIESAKKFYYDEKYCSVVGEKDFSELLNK